jgi:hypothetical protein
MVHPRSFARLPDEIDAFASCAAGADIVIIE